MACSSWLRCAPFGRAVGAGEVLPGREVEQVLPVRAARPRFQLRQFFLQLRRPVSPDERGQIVLSPPGRPGKHIDDGMGVRGDEVDRSFRRAQPVQHALGRKPPLVGGSGVAEMAAADHLHRVALAALRHELEVSPQSGSPDAPQPLPIRWLQSQPLADRRDLVVIERLTRRGARHERAQVGVVGDDAVHLVPLDLIGHDRWDEVVEIGRRGDGRGERALAVIPPAATASGG